MMQNQAVELLCDTGDKLRKGLNEQRVNEGVILYVEDANVTYSLNGTGESIGITKWEQEFELEMNRC